MTAQRIRTIIPSLIDSLTGLSVQFGDIRHLMIAFSRFFSDVSTNKLFQSILDAQASHSSSTAKTFYAVSNQDVKDLPSADVHAFHSASILWHEALGFYDGFILCRTKSQEQVVNIGRPINEIPVSTNVSESIVVESVNGSNTSKHIYNVNNHYVLHPGDLSVAAGKLIDQFVEREVTAAPQGPLYYRPRYIDSEKISPDDQKTFIGALALLQKFTENGYAMFKSYEQGLMMTKVLGTLDDYLMILPTGAGKSMAYLLPAFRDRIIGRESVTLLVVPLVSLFHDVVRKLKNLDVLYCVYGEEMDINKPFNLLVVRVDQIDTEKFETDLRTLHLTGRLERIVIDEVHTVQSHRSFRPCVQKLSSIRGQMKVPIIGLSATVPIYMRISLGTLFDTSFNVIASCTDRPELYYDIHSCNDTFNELPATFASILEVDFMGYDLNGVDRFIAFFPTKALLNSSRLIVEQRLEKWMGKILEYCGDHTSEERRISADEWINGTKPFMFATMAFSLGIDCPHVRRVYHVGGSQSLISYIQEIGRAGRDGQPAIARTIFSSRVQQSIVTRAESNIDEYDPGTDEGSLAVEASIDCQDFISYIQAQTCRRKYLQDYIDGSGKSCLMSSSTSHCDNCVKLLQHLHSLERKPEHELANTIRGHVLELPFKTVSELYSQTPLSSQSGSIRGQSFQSPKTRKDVNDQGITFSILEYMCIEVYVIQN